jgi:4-hydroxy-tetrahydrodipicolinate reductase
VNDGVIAVAIAGVNGKLGRVAYEAFANSAGVTLVGGLARKADLGNDVFDSLAPLVERGAQVLLDCTTRPGSVEISMAAAGAGIRPVVGTSGWTEEERNALAQLVEARGIGAMIVPNFSLGAVLMMNLAERAARFFPAVEIVEMHRDSKKDKPSGTSAETARRLATAGAVEPPIHSVRLPGLVAHQEVIFGGRGEVLTIRHDSFSYESFVPGMIAAVRRVVGLRGLAIGLDSILDA